MWGKLVRCERFGAPQTPSASFHNSTMSVIGEAALSGFLELLWGRLLDSALNFVADHKQVQQQLKQWQSILPDIQAVLNDAEEKQIGNKGVRNWLEDLQDLAYDMDDILDEFAYEELRLALLKTQAQASISKVRKLIPTCCTSSNFSPTSFLFNNSMIPKMKEITARLDSLTTRRNSLGLSEILSQGATSKGKKPRLQPTSVVDEAVEYVGRDDEKRKMLDLLKSNNSNGVFVLSIVGMGGMGKTTLAQLVYNDASTKESFDHRAWVCVSDEFDAVNITKTILQSITSEPCAYNDLNLLQVKLKEKLSGKKCLLVLDDIWNESYEDWTTLRSPFGAGTKIIVTTRIQNVSSNVDPVKAFHLDKLSHDDCLSIFTQHALKARNFNGHLQFKEVGENIVRRCNGLPLAAKAIGSLLRTVKDLGEWEKIYESEIWDLPEDQCGILPALRLSYHHLPPQLKRCFAYCSIFPKDYEFQKEEIILLWRAEGFLQLKLKGQIKDPGNQYFQDLASRSFFQISSKDKSRFIMHHLINDLAQSVAGEICCKLEDDKQQMFSNRTRHSSFIVSRLSNFVIGKGDGHYIGELKNLPNLKGDFCISGLENVNGQHAGEVKLNEKLGIDRLVLQWSSNFEKDARNKEAEERVLDSLRHQKKLEQLNIDNYGGAKFSSWIADSSFKNMLSLELCNCTSCKSLPSIGLLPLLKDLSIIGFDEVQKVGAEFFGENQLKPFVSLENLHFQRLPNWKEWDPCEGEEQVSKFPNLRELSIRECPQLLEKLPTRLPSLLKLQIYECPRLTVSISSFPSLCELSVRGCEELLDECSFSAKEVISLKTVSLSDISKFNISTKMKMLRFASSEHFHIPGWKELESLSQNGLGLVGHHFITIKDCPQLVSLETDEEGLKLDKIPSVESLTIWNCKRLNRLPKFLDALSFLTVVSIYGCSGLISFAENNFPPALNKLEIWECENLQNLVYEKENNKSMSSNICLLEHLDIRYCESLICLSSRGDVCNRLRHLQVYNCSSLSSLFLNTKLPTMLKQLEIWNCPMLECIAQDFHETSDLECIKISGAQNIKSLPRGLDKLNHLQEIQIVNCSNMVVSFKESELPTTNLRVFSIEGCENFGALPMCINNFISLRELMVWNCSADISFPDEGFPTGLTSLAISNAPKIYSSLVEWGLTRLTSLQQLTIGGEGCSNVVSFPEEGIGMMLPPSLTFICIENFENLEFMYSKGFQHINSLQILSIHNFPKLTSLPEKGMLLSLERLHIYECLLLEKVSTRDKGREWSKIAHIPYVNFKIKKSRLDYQLER
ncbi:putative disease resistance RPP13-like protein 1 isoform X4 [Gossypium hirsutum]|uniref:Disease resistance RPP13-like protein 1 isoform X4 n=1 Tax=Gossypium hirsutum TaxID=3635 RepID=A0ABM2ZZW6_GOSHI|nr:putative disease resistance RPP13-like protein 1 isoform X4 [Gossypium hirsutum]